MCKVLQVTFQIQKESKKKKQGIVGVLWWLKIWHQLLWDSRDGVLPFLCSVSMQSKQGALSLLSLRVLSLNPWGLRKTSKFLSTVEAAFIGTALLGRTCISWFSNCNSNPGSHLYFRGATGE